MQVFAAQVDQPFGKQEHVLLVTEFEAAFTAKTMKMRPGPQIPNFYRQQQPFSQAEVEAGVLAVGIHKGIALALTEEQALRTLHAYHRTETRKAERAWAYAQAQLIVVKGNLPREET